ncbi:MAG: FecR family protein [Nitrospira sp.]
MSTPPTSSGNTERSRARDEANVWVLRMHSGLMSSEQRRAFEVWHARSPVHQEQFRDAERFWDALDGLAGQVTRERHESTHDHSIGRHTFSRIWQQPLWQSIAATFLVVATTVLLWSTLTLRLSDYHTAPGEQKSVTLADGSTVFLNTESAFSVKLTEDRRRLTLAQGEALFQVAHDTARPFEVMVDGWAVRAVGTIFNIDRHTDRITITVLEGAVRLQHHNDAWDIPVGYQISYDGDHIASEMEFVDTAKVVAWRNGEFSFTNMPLGAIVEELNRYRSGKIVIATTSLRDLRVSGSISLRDPDQSLTILQKVFPFKTTHLTPYLTIVS